MPPLIPWLWTAFFLWWLIRSIGVKPTRVRESLWARFGQAAVVTLAFILITWRWDRQGIFAFSFLSDPARAELGPALTLFTLLGIGFAVWAREHLGRNWSAQVTVKEDHKLIRTGPYALIRHPIYTGLLVATLASALAVGRINALAGFAVLAVSFWFKSRKEERWMEGEFGAAYDDYRKVSGHFLPRVVRGG
ncbi:MAG TPA: isoprenylcysteine carboxylmethyltransferase family protein [Gemmatimonadales bacterium]|nr:isoprenylcysteine carboxylmethyltransferase family protein [Gemmatimonadales bacterium]